MFCPKIWHYASMSSIDGFGPNKVRVNTMHYALLRFLSLIFLMCICIPLFTSCSSTKTIVNGLEEKDANEIIVFLQSKGIDASKVHSTEGGGAGGGAKVVLWDIHVPSESAMEAMSLLNQSGLPRRRGQSLLGIFSAGGLVPSEMQEQIRYQAGLAEQIASTIRKIDGVLDSEVQISFPKEDPLNPGKFKQKITASVYVKHSGVLDDPNSHLLTKIKRLVAASITGLDYDDVTVIADRARYSGVPTAGAGASNEEEKQFVSVWTIIIAKDSVTRFRILFFSFLLLLLLLLLGLIWLAWKIYPLLHKYGGMKELFHTHPIDLSKTEEIDKGKKEAAEKPAAEESKEKSEEEGKMDETT